jgi:hypothetical protein
MGHDSMRNWRRFHALPSVLGTVLVLGAAIAGCDRAPPHSQEAPTANVVASPPAPSVTPSATEGTSGGKTANANDPPMKSMSKQEESSSMPQPGQANDHSTLATDSKK